MLDSLMLFGGESEEARLTDSDMMRMHMNTCQLGCELFIAILAYGVWIHVSQMMNKPVLIMLTKTNGACDMNRHD